MLLTNLPECLTALDTMCFFFNDPPATQIYTLSLHDALPILVPKPPEGRPTEHDKARSGLPQPLEFLNGRDRKSTRLNSSHVATSYAVFCLKKKTALLPDPTSISDKYNRSGATTPRFNVSSRS